ncbi:unnamed protein product [Arabidopsis lyrata]|nr:unnamed protein product [Arabidopsis lyrata]
MFWQDRINNMLSWPGWRDRVRSTRKSTVASHAPEPARTC